LLVVVAIAFKLSARGAAEAPTFDFVTRITDLMQRNGFTVDYALPPDALMDGIGGRSGDCRLLIVNASPFGYNEDSVKRSAAAGDTVFFIYKSARYNEQPRWRTSVDFYWKRLNRVLGRLLPQDPVFGVVASPACGSEPASWLEEAHLT